MSYNETLGCIRFKLPIVGTYHEVYSLLKNIFGEADDVEIYDNTIEYFTYESLLNTLNIRLIHDDKHQWGIDYVFYHQTDYDLKINQFPTGMQINECLNIINDIKQRYVICNDVEPKIVYYTYYNGSDEPINF